MNTSYVYIFPMKDKSSFKVGKSKNPYKRFSQLLNFYDIDKDSTITFQCQSENDSFIIENIIHRSFQNSRILHEYDGGTEFFSYDVFDSVIKLFDILLPEFNLIKAHIRYNDINTSHDSSNTDMLLMKIGNSIKRKRLHLNISQQKIANIANTTRATIIKLEKGHNSSSLSLALTVMDILEMNDIFDNLYTNSKNLKCRPKRS